MTRAARPTRKKRIPLAGPRDVLTVEGKEEGYVYRWVNDIDNGRRVSRLQDAGYELVEQDGITVGDTKVDKSVKEGRQSVVTENVGGGITAVLMRTKQEFYDEDQVTKQKEIDDREADMKQKLNSGENGQYGRVSIT